MRKKLFLVIMIIAAIILPLYSQNSSGGQHVSGSNIPIAIKGSNSGEVHRPKAPSKQSIDCFYDGEKIYISFLFPEGTSSITVTEVNLPIHSEYFDSSEDTEIYVGTLLSDKIYRIEITTSYGNVYEYEGYID